MRSAPAVLMHLEGPRPLLLPPLRTRQGSCSRRPHCPLEPQAARQARVPRGHGLGEAAASCACGALGAYVVDSRRLPISVGEQVGSPPAPSLFAQAAPTPRARLAAAAQVPRHPTHASDGGAPSGNWRAEMRFPQIGLLGWDTSGRGRLRLESAKSAGSRTPKFAAGVCAFQCFRVCTLKH